MSTTYMSRISQGSGSSHSCAYCHGFGKIPSLIAGSDGKWHLNPDAEMVKSFQVRAEPYGLTLAPGQSEVFSITVPAEGEAKGDLLINQLKSFFTPNTARDISVEMINNQTSRIFQNGPIFNTLLMGDSFLNCCLPCCTLVEATQTLSLNVTNNEAVPVAVRIVAEGKRFLPRSEELRARMLMYWNTIPSFPYFLTLDETEVPVLAGQTVETLMTVPGTGDFEIKWPRCEVRPIGVSTPDVNDIQVTLTEQIGRELQTGALELGAFVATPTLAVAGFPGGLYRAAAACHCPPSRMLLKRNMRLRVGFTNTSLQDAMVRLTFAGCFHQVDECPPGRSMDRIRSLEPTIGPLLVAQENNCPPEQVPSYRQAETAHWTPNVAVPPPPVPMQRPMLAPVAGGGGSVAQGGPLSYMQKYYQAAPGGGAAPINAAAHGYAPGQPIDNRAAFSGLGDLPHGTIHPRNPSYAWDARTRTFRRFR